MKPTREQIQDAYDEIYHCSPLGFTSVYTISQETREVITSVLQSALEAKPVDIEALKQFIVDETCDHKDCRDPFVQGIYAAVEVLAETGRLAGGNGNQHYMNGYEEGCRDAEKHLKQEPDQDVREALDKLDKIIIHAEHRNGISTIGMDEAIVIRDAIVGIISKGEKSTVNIPDPAYVETYNEIVACIENDEDGACDLFDAMTGKHGIVVLNALSQRPAVPDGYALVPIEPTETMWGGLARDIVMFTRMNTGSGCTGKNLHRHLKALGKGIPQWLCDEVEERDHVIPKGTVAAIIYKAMLAAAPKQGD